MTMKLNLKYCSNKGQPFSHLNKNFVILVFFCCMTVTYSSDCTVVNTDTSESGHILERLKPLIGRTANATLLDTTGKSIPFTIRIYSDQAAGMSVFSGTTSFGTCKQTKLSSGKNFIDVSYSAPAPASDECTNTTGGRMSNIILTCDPETDFGKVQVMETNPGPNLMCSYTFQVGTRYACVLKDGLSGGSIFCILFFTGVSLYLLLGFLYQRLLVGAKGLEQIPNYSFWRDFGNLQADGCDFVCRCGPRQEAQSYRGIDDRLPRDDERDDQLLNM